MRALALPADEKQASLNWLPASFGKGEVSKCGDVTVTICVFTEPCELTRIDDRLFGDITARRYLRDFLIREIDPFIISIGKVRVGANDSFDGLIVLRSNPRNISCTHGDAP